MSHICCHTDRNEQRKRRVVYEPVFVVEGLGVATTAKVCPDQPRSFKEVNNSQACFRRKKPYIYVVSIRFRNETVLGAPGHPLKRLLGNTRTIDCVDKHRP